jgi:lysophospholipase L1-like esterase
MHITGIVRRGLPLLSLLAALVAAAPAHADHYAALGDSYSAGAGVGGALDGGTLDACGHGALSYPMLVAPTLPAEEMQFLACGGATAASVQTQAAKILPGTDFVTLTAGGNDVGFSPLIGSCMRSASSCTSATATAQLLARNTLPARLDATYAAVARQAPGAKIYVLDYPRLVAGTCSRTGAMTATSVQQLNAVADTLRRTISARTSAAGPRFLFVDVIPRFIGHALCSHAPWIGDDFHPNSIGHRDGSLAEISAARAR